MSRLAGPSEALQNAVPAALTEVFAVLTTLGHPTFLVGVVGLLYWVSDDRRASATLVCYALVAVAVTVTLKEGLALPRPPAELRAVAVTPDSYGFPSGHATGATAVYGGALVLYDRLRGRAAVAAVVALVGVVGLSRVVLGVHYFGDVLAGFAVGGAVLAGLWLGLGHRRVAVCLLGAVVSVAAVLVTGGGTDAVFALGASLAAAAVFAVVDPVALPTPRSPGEAILVVVAGGAFVGGVYGLVSLLDSPALGLVGSAVTVGGALLVPALPREFLAPRGTR